MRTLLLSLLCLLCLLACAVEQEPDPLPQPVSQPVDLSGGQGPSGGLVVGGPQLPATCHEEDFQRCSGQTLQNCNHQTQRWEDFIFCDATDQRCTANPRQCSGIVGDACCVAM